jgi:hypothetical protein
MKLRDGAAIDSTEDVGQPSRFAPSEAEPRFRVPLGEEVQVESLGAGISLTENLLADLLNRSHLAATTTTSKPFIYLDPATAEFTVAVVARARHLLEAVPEAVEEPAIAQASEAESLVERVAEELANPAWDFRTVSGLARSLEQTRDAIEQVLDENPHLVRWIAATNNKGEQLVVSRERPVTQEERYLVLRSALSKSFA